MAKPRINPADPFAVDLSDQARQDLAAWLCDEVQGAYDARVSVIGPQGDLDYAHWLYEQGRTPVQARRWPGAADLTSYLVTEKVDALRSRVMKTIFAEPFAIVEGWGEDAQKAPFIEEFHEWKRGDEQLWQYLSKTIHNSFLEQNGILEVIDRQDIRLIRKLESFAAKLAEDGSTLLDPRNQPIIDRDDTGKPKPAQPDQPFVKAATATYQTVRKGPGYRVLSQRDFLFLPSHAADKSELFGYAKRVWLRMGQITELAESGEYDPAAVTRLGESSDRDSPSPSLERQGVTIAEQRDSTAEKELWSVLFLKDLDGDGLEEWYIATVSLIHRELLRVKHDDLGTPRYIDFTPFPRSDSVYGYSFVLDKLATTTEEHTALRNMIADRSTLATTPPIKRLQGALWDPNEQPWGTGQVIDVRDPNELIPFDVPDVPASALQREAAMLQAAERITGVNDTAVGIQSQERRTATEVQEVAVAGAVRTEEVVKNLQPALQTLDQVRHEIWIRTLEAMPDGGMEAPESVVRSLQTRGLSIQNGKFTAAQLKGNVRFKPHGSVETADKQRMRADWNGFLSALAGLAQMNPLVARMLQSPDVLQTIIEQVLRLYNVPDKQPFIVALKQVVQQAQQQAEMAQQLAQQGGIAPPGAMPPGAPAGPGGPGGSDPRELLAMLAQAHPDLAQALAGGTGASQ